MWLELPCRDMSRALHVSAHRALRNFVPAAYFFSSRDRHETAWRKGKDQIGGFEGDLVLFLLQLPFKLANVHELTHAWWRRVNLAGSAVDHLIRWKASVDLTSFRLTTC